MNEYISMRLYVHMYHHMLVCIVCIHIRNIRVRAYMCLNDEWRCSRPFAQQCFHYFLLSNAASILYRLLFECIYVPYSFIYISCHVSHDTEILMNACKGCAKATLIYSSSNPFITNIFICIYDTWDVAKQLATRTRNGRCAVDYERLSLKGNGNWVKTCIADETKKL